MAVFSRVLTKIDVERRLSLTTDDDEAVLPPFLGGEQPVLLRMKDENGDVWSFRRCTMLKRSGIRPKLLIDDSRQFVRSRGLNVGDEINVYPEDRIASSVITHKPKIKWRWCFPIGLEYHSRLVFWHCKIEVIRKNRGPSH